MTDHYFRYASLTAEQKQMSRWVCASCLHLMTRHRSGGCNGLGFYETRKVPRDCDCQGFVREDEQLDLIRDTVPEGRYRGVL